jgi:tetratricopeptide (TPR) repeat protein
LTKRIGPQNVPNPRTLEKVGDEFKVTSQTPPVHRSLQSFPRLRLSVISAVLFVWLLAPSVRAADPFYMRLLSQGTDAFNRHDYQKAAHDLRIACFGFLEEPTLLADGLTRLALAQAAAGDETGFRETFQRLSEVQERFQGYSRADIPQDVRSAFEAAVVKTIPQATLAGNAAFSRLVPTRQDEVSKLPPAQQRKELKRLIKSEPTEVRWRLMLAELELGEGNFSDAIAAANGALKISPASRDALRLRGLALAAQKKWPQAESDLKACGLASSDPKVAGALLTTLDEQKRWQEASDLAAQLPPTVAKDPIVQEASATAAAGLKATQPTGAPPATRHPPETATSAQASGAGVTAGVAAPGPAATATPTPTQRAVAPTKVAAVATPPPFATKPVTGQAAAAGGVGVLAAAATRTPTPRPPSKPAPGAATGTIASAAPAPSRAPSGGPLTAADRAELDRAGILAGAGDLDGALALARTVADAHPDVAEPQFVTAELAYRTSRWKEAVAYFRRGGDPGTGQPLLLFYEAVSLYEAGDRAGAAVPMKRCLPLIRHTPFVDEYTAKILGSAAPATQKP